jgi:filamentous hemagglutinin
MEEVIYKMFQGAVPPNYVKVSRWISQNESNLWKGCTHIPNDIGRGTQVYVTNFGAAKPAGGVGNYRVDFLVPREMLQRGSKSEEYQIIGPWANTPIYNIVISKIT